MADFVHKSSSLSAVEAVSLPACSWEMGQENLCASSWATSPRARAPHASDTTLVKAMEAYLHAESGAMEQTSMTCADMAGFTSVPLVSRMLGHEANMPISPLTFNRQMEQMVGAL